MFFLYLNDIAPLWLQNIITSYTIIINKKRRKHFLRICILFKKQILKLNTYEHNYRNDNFYDFQ